VLEVGINLGGSIKLWNDFFVNANVYGLDTMNINDVWNEIKIKDKIILHTSLQTHMILILLHLFTFQYFLHSQITFYIFI
jgi:hypothetical protein